MIDVLWLLPPTRTTERRFRTLMNPSTRIINQVTQMFFTLLLVASSFHQVSPFQRDSTHSQRNQLRPPFPNGPCGGNVITIPPEDTYGVDVNLANVNIGGDLVMPPRPIHVWLPPGYEGGTETHPVLYCHDGQNAIQDSWSWTGGNVHATWFLKHCNLALTLVFCD